MSQKTESGRDAFGPRPRRRAPTDRKPMTFRVEPFLRKKLTALTVIENGVSQSGDPEAGHISDNAELNYILRMFIEDYEKAYGVIPDPEDGAGIQRHIKARRK